MWNNHDIMTNHHFRKQSDCKTILKKKLFSVCEAKCCKICDDNFKSCLNKILTAVQIISYAVCGLVSLLSACSGRAN